MKRDLLTRVARAVHLNAEPIDAHRWRVTGGRSPHVVDARTWRCDCPDAVLRGRLCKHALAVRLRSADDLVLGALRELVAIPRRTRRAAP